MRNIETFPSKQMYFLISLVERKEAEFYHNIDRRHCGLVRMTYFHPFFQIIAGVLASGPQMQFYWPNIHLFSEIIQFFCTFITFIIC